jgi:hypothetical protein
VRNLPWYRGWHEKFSAKGLTVIGIHTPESEPERNIETVRQKVKEHAIEYPVAVDNESKSWNAWTNRFWPAVYLIDKRGYVREWWYGELNWQGTEGERFMRERVEELLAEEN